jgi:hypothetical protein
LPALQPAALQHIPSISVALLGGAIGALSELPNSLLKRQLDITTGKPGRGLAAPFFYVYDQVDFLVGAWLVMLVWVTPSRTVADTSGWAFGSPSIGEDCKTYLCATPGSVL